MWCCFEISKLYNVFFFMSFPKLLSEMIAEDKGEPMRWSSFWFSLCRAALQKFAMSPRKRPISTNGL